MTTPSGYLTVRITPHAARLFLQHQGYFTVHVTKSALPIDFLAWKERNELLFVHVVSSRTKQGTPSYRNLVGELCSLVRKIPLPGEMQLMVYSGCSWNRFRVKSGGIYAMSGECT